MAQFVATILFLARVSSQRPVNALSPTSLPTPPPERTITATGLERGGSPSRPTASVRSACSDATSVGCDARRLEIARTRKDDAPLDDMAVDERVERTDDR